MFSKESAARTEGFFAVEKDLLATRRTVEGIIAKFMIFGRVGAGQSKGQLERSSLCRHSRYRSLVNPFQASRMNRFFTTNFSENFFSFETSSFPEPVRNLLLSRASRFETPGGC